MNRADRRAAARGRGVPELVGYRTSFTHDELVILEEALALWVHQTRQDLEGLELADHQRWALQRGERLRQGLLAALEDRPWHDIAPERTEPTEGTHVEEGHG